MRSKLNFEHEEREGQQQQCRPGPVDRGGEEGSVPQSHQTPQCEREPVQPPRLIPVARLEVQRAELHFVGKRSQDCRVVHLLREMFHPRADLDSIGGGRDRRTP